MLGRHAPGLHELGGAIYQRPEEVVRALELPRPANGTLDVNEIFEEVLAFWFGDSLDSPDAVDARSELWFAQNNSFDRSIRDRFGSLPDRALAGEFEHWRREPRPALALVLVLDQFPRNLYRGSPRSYEFDSKACEIALASIEAGFDQSLHPLEASFLYLPLEHSENLLLQERSVQLFEKLIPRAPVELRASFEQSAEFAVRHREVIRRFGRFPHRNAVLGRRSSQEELAYLESGGETFGTADAEKSED
jgi:uncharacterized protein (DUF924 family)